MSVERQLNQLRSANGGHRVVGAIVRLIMIRQSKVRQAIPFITFYVSNGNGKLIKIMKLLHNNTVVLWSLIVRKNLQPGLHVHIICS